MIRDVVNTIKEYAIVGVCIGGVSALIRPFVSIKQSLRDTVITFTVAVITGLLLNNIQGMPYSLKVGLSSIAGLYAVRIYMIIDALLLTVEKNPEIIVDKVVHRKRKDEDENH